MSTQHVGNEQVNLRNHGGGSFDKGLGVPIRVNAGDPPLFPDAAIQVSVNPDTLRLEVWDNDNEAWISVSESTLLGVTTGPLANITTNRIYVNGLNNPAPATYTGLVLDYDPTTFRVSLRNQNGLLGNGAELQLGVNSFSISQKNGNNVLVSQGNILSTPNFFIPAAATNNAHTPNLGQVKAYLPKVFQTDSSGILSDSYLVGKNVVGMLGGGAILVGGINSLPGLDFIKAIGDQTITLTSGSLAASTYYTLIFGES